MTPEAAAALAVVVGGVLAIVPRDTRIVPFGLLLALVAAPFASASPTTFALGARVVGGVLAAYVLWIPMRRRTAGDAKGGGSAIGPAAEACLAAAAFVVGTQPAFVTPLDGLAWPQAAGFALLALSAAPLLGSDPRRLARGLVTLTLGLILVANGWLGAGTPLAELVETGLLIAVAATAAMMLGSAKGEIEELPAPEPFLGEIGAPEPLAVAEPAAVAGADG